MKTEMVNLSRLKREKLELNTELLDLEKQIYEMTESLRSKMGLAEQNLKQYKQVNFFPSSSLIKKG